MALTPDEVQKVGTLARLSLTSDEAQALTPHLNDLLGQFARLQTLDTTGVAPTSHAVPVEARLRPDVAAPSLPRDTVLALGPQTDADLGGFIVPQVLGE